MTHPIDALAPVSLHARKEEANFLTGGDEFLPLHQFIRATGIPVHKHGRRILALDPAFAQDGIGLTIACHEVAEQHRPRVLVTAEL